MSDNAKEIRKWIAGWQQASAALLEQKKKELRAADYYEKNRGFLDEMLQYACENRQERRTSGLVEQQRWFMKLRDKETSGR